MRVPAMMGGVSGMANSWDADRLTAIYATQLAYTRSDTSPSGNPNSNVFSVIDTIV